MDKITLLVVLSLGIGIIGNLFFLLSMIYFNEALLLISLTQMMSGGIVFYMLSPKLPILFKKEKRLKRK